MGGRLVDTAFLGRCPASIKSRQTSPTGDERQNKSKSGPSPADSLNESQLAARSGTSPPRRTSPTTPMRTASLDAVTSTPHAGVIAVRGHVGAAAGLATMHKARTRYREVRDEGGCGDGRSCGNGWNDAGEGPRAASGDK